ncbi:phosphoenolpyruvate synthase [Reticulibacter mediterranei]|uniref:Phosphoenolpyruvate synthase n=1 Tax=Reticulibacter mediterranei TaxID=2778369 RepID=A0A8J3ITL5_9CHLR|nr:PEP/pyruvate-binding domain-containing protein [Reticulibacter mediterranei]GHO97684.1 phosphoenolpyruvate synthase [Reticulibacter mediterranei]
MQDQTYPLQTVQSRNDALTLPLNTLDANAIGQVGGKGANLGELIGAGLPVPDGFCVTTAAYDLVSQQAGLEQLLDELAATHAGDIAHLEYYAAELRQRLGAVAIPSVLVEALRESYQQLAHDTPVAVAVRSSATAEDLPFASFAGQQDTLLNIISFDGLLDAVRRCWASLWNDRAVSYRASNNIDPRTVRLAVVVQRMINATVAGVLFTANPLTGRRRQAVIDASPGLGEAVVSGAVTPDHFVVNTQSGEIVERRLGQKRLRVRALSGGGTEQQILDEIDETSCLTDEQIRSLAMLGAQVESHFGAPQDTEWAIDDAGKLWLTQARPITTLYPLPADAPVNDEDARIYFSLNVAQGVYRPFTPMGASYFRLVASAGAKLAGFPPRNVLAGPSFAQEAAHRLFLDVTPMFRSTFWRPALIGIMGQMEARSAPVFAQLAADPRFAPVPTPRRSVMRKLIPLLIRTRGLPLLRMAQALLDPPLVRARFAYVQQQIRLWSQGPLETTPLKLLASAEGGARSLMPYMFPNLIPIVGLVFGLPALARRLLRGLATEDEIQTVRRGLPYNPTTEMDLQLWQLAQRLREDATIRVLFHEQEPAQLAQAYNVGSLPAPLQTGLSDFLALYGHRGVAEIDLGLPRWSEDPSYLLGMLANYIALGDSEAAPDIQFQRSVQEAEAMAQTLIQRARRHGWLRGLLTSLCLHRLRELSGLREVPKFNIVLIFAGARRRLFAVGEELARCHRLEAAEDIFYITLVEAHEALAGRDMRAIVRERRSSYERELGRRHIPRIMLSDGTEPEAALTLAQGASQEGTLQGVPASPGVVTGKARVILDPAGARLEPGEILVAPSTDPGWTPLFFTASGLVMEMGGSMSHGAIVAREYGIPAVVGVSGAIERITTGQQITVDGSRGIITSSN